MARQITAKLLQTEWRVDVSHGLYSRDGTWYHRLVRFPGALFDASGYIVFQTEQEFINCPQLRINQDCGCRDGISNIPGYVSVTARQASDTDITSSAARVTSTICRIVRDTAIARELKFLHQDICQICAQTIILLDGTYSEAHHIRPLGNPHNGADSKGNIIVVCPSCHVRLDYFSIELPEALMLNSLHRISKSNLDYHNLQWKIRGEQAASSNH